VGGTTIYCGSLLAAKIIINEYFVMQSAVFWNYNLKDLSKKLKISIRTLREYVKSGELKAKKIGKAYYVTEISLMAFLAPDS
jgi:hypothetical protein